MRIIHICLNVAAATIHGDRDFLKLDEGFGMSKRINLSKCFCEINRDKLSITVANAITIDYFGHSF